MNLYTVTIYDDRGELDTSPPLSLADAVKIGTDWEREGRWCRISRVEPPLTLLSESA